MVEAQETNASKLSLLQRHREARELLVKIQADEADYERPRRPQSASCSETFGKRLAQSSRPKSAVPTTSEPSAAANLHFRPAPNPLPPHLGGGSAPSAPRKRPLSAFPSRTVSPVGRRPASACGVRERFVHSQVPDLDMNVLPRFRDAGCFVAYLCLSMLVHLEMGGVKEERAPRTQAARIGIRDSKGFTPKICFLNEHGKIWIYDARQKAKNQNEKSLRKRLSKAYRSRSWS